MYNNFKISEILSTTYHQKVNKINKGLTILPMSESQNARLILHCRFFPHFWGRLSFIFFFATNGLDIFPFFSLQNCSIVFLCIWNSCYHLKSNYLWFIVFLCIIIDLTNTFFAAWLIPQDLCKLSISKKRLKSLLREVNYTLMRAI